MGKEKGKKKSLQQQLNKGDVIGSKNLRIMKSNIFDKNGIEVCNGDTLIFPYVDPMGKLHNEEDFRKTVVFKYGCFGYETETKFIPLMEWMETERGEYISNCGNKIVYTEKYPFWVQR